MKNSFTILLLLIILVPININFSQNFWQQTNGPTGGNVMTLAVNSNGDIFAGSRGGGMLRSTNSGENWEQINNG
jgi:hypothetical protein